MPKSSKRNVDAQDQKGLATCSIIEAGVFEDFQSYWRNEVPGWIHGNRDLYILNLNLQRNACIRARDLAVTNYWLKSFLKLKRSVINYGYELNPISGKDKALNKWLDSKVPRPSFGDEETQRQNAANPNIGVPGGSKTYREQIAKFVKDAIMEFILLDSVVSFWSDEQKYAICLPHENIRYRDVFGVETLFFTGKLTPEQLRLLPPAMAERFKMPQVPVDEAKGEYFKVLKEERDGYGLPWPAVQSCFRTLATMESMEISESAYAFLGRLKFRHHKMGHEIKQGNNAGKPTHFWGMKRARAFLQIVDKKSGSIGDVTTNFDHDLSYPHEDEKFFTETKWGSPEHRLRMWGGPLAELMLSTGVTPYLTQFLKADMSETRKTLKSFLQNVINEAWDIPTPIEIIWSDTIFNDAALFGQLLQFGVSCGAISQSTFREQAGFNDAREAVKKEEEATAFKKNNQAFKPAYDPAHGDPNDKGGAPRGNVNKDHA